MSFVVKSTKLNKSLKFNFEGGGSLVSSHPIRRQQVCSPRSEQSSELASLFGCWKDRPPAANTRKVAETASNLTQEAPVEPGPV